ncbi:hypothetical protein HanPSC8_Chr10g0434251 [Helianthus annuus]|nr:hypothetical protein HanPSC8_Chr10g0434251 [Helianthus annuus]
MSNQPLHGSYRLFLILIKSTKGAFTVIIPSDTLAPPRNHMYH